MGIELAELIGQLRAELSAAMAAGEGEELRFELGPVQLELAVKVDKEAKAGAKVRFWVVDASTDGKLASSTTQTIKLTLDPHRAGSPGVKPVIAGGEREGER
jgi:NTP-dependent ternary system trypsin peptidase co-occuring protein